METTPSPRSAPRVLRPDDGRLLRGRRSRAQIREAFRALFRENGFDGTTLRAIAERAGMGASSIYRHIQSKEELLVEELAVLQERAWREIRQRGERGIIAARYASSRTSRRAYQRPANSNCSSNSASGGCCGHQ